MLRHRLYYSVKPLIPLAIRRSVRRWFAAQKLKQVGAVWPVLPGSDQPPKGWLGWPGGKKFAFVLTHDVESKAGLAKSRDLFELERKAGFRASFNFIPEGDYSVSGEFRKELGDHGFEVGVHDLYHDGKLYHSRPSFAARARKINKYLEEWGAAGFRSGFMHHNLNWLHDLNIQYDASTFDTDPFEPQPEGAHTVFPFWVKGSGGRGYVELPYTLPQDSTLFLILGQKSSGIWREKLDWIAERGGMALLDTHPDYIDFSGGKPGRGTYPASFYKEFLDYVQVHHQGTYWHATAREVASHVRCMRESQPREELTSTHQLTVNGSERKKIWIDLDNTPHVPLFTPVARELSARGYEVVLTARDAFQVCELARKKNLPFVRIGRHHGKNRFRKLTGLFLRAAQLAPLALRERPLIGLSHGSRSQILICNLLRIPTVLMADYEFAQYPPMMRPTWEMAPEVIPDEALSCPKNRVKKYPGIKEDIYIPDFSPEPGFRGQLGIGKDETLAVVRPPATEAHYHNPEAEGLFARFMDRACQTENVRVVLLPRNKKQADVLKAEHASWFEDERTVIPKGAVDGLDLIWHSDLVVSGGGTMNREAAALHVPVYSVFRGKIGAVDHQLQKEGRLTLIETAAQVDGIPLARRPALEKNGRINTLALERVVNNVISIVEHHSWPRRRVRGGH